jgi:hypothetical protein
MEAINIGIFIIVEGIYIYSINNVGKRIDEIKEKMTSTSIVTRIMGSSNRMIPDKNIVSNFDNMVNLEAMYNLSYHTAGIGFKNAEVLNWIVLEKILSKEWDSFSFLGFQVTNSLIIQKLLAVLLAAIAAKTTIDVVSA